MIVCVCVCVIHAPHISSGLHNHVGSRVANQSTTTSRRRRRRRRRRHHQATSKAARGILERRVDALSLSVSVQTRIDRFLPCIYRRDGDVDDCSSWKGRET